MLSPVNFCLMCMCSLLSCVRLFATPWTVACQAPRSMEFSGQESCSGLPFPSPGYHPNFYLITWIKWSMSINKIAATTLTCWVSFVCTILALLVYYPIYSLQQSRHYYSHFIHLSHSARAWQSHWCLSSIRTQWVQIWALGSNFSDSAMPLLSGLDV